MSIIDDLKSEKTKKYVSLRVKVEAQYDEILEVIVANSGVTKQEYLSLIIAKSEIVREYHKVIKDTRKNR